MAGMSQIDAPKLVSVADYLAGEEDATVRHEYVGGMIYAMAGAKNVHNRIASNCLIALGAALRGKPCDAFNSDTKVRLQSATQTRFYYPDASVVCAPNPPDDTFQDRPAVVVEVVSESTRRIDEGEKREAYLTIPSLSAYLLVEQDRPVVCVYRRGDQGFAREVYQGLDAVIPLGEIDASLALSELYDGVTFPQAGDGH